MRGRGSFYTPRGKRRCLGSKTSVKSRDIEQISRKGRPFRVWEIYEKCEVEGLDRVRTI
jgi:hypothetical protein